MRKFLIFFVLLALTSANCAPSTVYNADDFKRISAITARVLSLNHYSRAQMTAELSARIFDNFIDSLDPARMFFSSEEIKLFSAEREVIGFKLQRGEYQFAFSMYDLFKKNFHKYKSFCEQLLEKGVDLTGNDTFVTDRSKVPRCKTAAELETVWRQKITNDLLLYKLMERAEKDAAAKKDNKDKADGDKKTAFTKPSPEKRIRQRLRDLANDIDKRDNIDILGLLLDSMAQAYGAHSNYHPPKLSEDFEIHMSLSLTGIGATLTSENGYIKIVELVAGGPAEQSGKLKVNDRLISVTQENGETTDLIDMPVSKAVQFIRGPKGSKLTLDVLSGEGAAAHTEKVTIVRDKINLVASAAKGEVKEIDGKNGKVKVGLLTVPSFYMDFDAVSRGDANARRVSADVRKILNDFREKGVQSVLIDLRRNGGGSLPDAIVMTGLFMRGGPVVQIRSSRQLGIESDEDPAIIYNGPLVILTSKMSASAAEIFTAALRDINRAVVVGDSRTFGKGTVLRVESLDRYNRWFGGARPPAGTLTFEMAMFYRSTGGSVQQLGIAPDIKLPSLTEEMKIGEIYMDNHLPWDSIKPVQREMFYPDLDKKIAVLRRQSEARRSENSRYKLFMQQIEIYRQLRDRKAVSLNENERYKQYLKEKEISGEVEKLMSDTSEKDKNKKARPDFVLDEALNIAADFYDMTAVKTIETKK